MLHAVAAEQPDRRYDLAIGTDRTATPLAKRKALLIGVAVANVILTIFRALPKARATVRHDLLRCDDVDAAHHDIFDWPIHSTGLHARNCVYD